MREWRSQRHGVMIGKGDAIQARTMMIRKLPDVMFCTRKAIAGSGPFGDDSWVPYTGCFSIENTQF